MARRPRTARPELEFRCEERLVENARAFLTIGPDDFGVWEASEPEFDVPEGAFVRVEPPESVDDALVARLRDWLLRAGALRVVVLPRRRRAAVLAPKERRPHRRAREVVRELVAESAAEDRELVGAFCEEVMARRSL